MAKGRFEPDPNPFRPCTGTCGRMTRPQKMHIDEAAALGYTDTVIRRNGICEMERKQALKAAAEADGSKAREAAERLELARRARETIEAQRAARAAARRPRRVGLGQAMVRI